MNRRFWETPAGLALGGGRIGGTCRGFVIWLLVLPTLWIGGTEFAAARAPTWIGAGAGPRVSVMEIPLSIDLKPLFVKAEELLPREVGHWTGWRKQHGVEIQYRAWRGPLRMAVAGDLLQVEAHVRYWIRGRRRILGGFGLEVGCGADEPPRQAVVGLQVRLGWEADWTLRPRFRVLPTRFIGPCEITAADINVSPILDRLFRGRMEETLRAAFAELRPRLEAARSHATQYWAALQQPVEMTDGFWLSAEPLALALAPPWGQGDQLRTNLGVVLLLAVGAEPVVAPAERPLPPLQTFIPHGAGMRFDLALDIDLAGLGRHLSALVACAPVTVDGHQIDIRSVDLRGEGSDLVLTAELVGKSAGNIEIRAHPVFDATAQSIRLKELDFVFEPLDPDQALMVDLFYQRIQQALQDSANALLTARADRLRHGLESALSRALSRDLILDLSSLRLAELDLAVLESSIRLRGTAAGDLVLRRGRSDGLSTPP